jgi:hypothetical protein
MFVQAAARPTSRGLGGLTKPDGGDRLVSASRERLAKPRKVKRGQGTRALYSNSSIAQAGAVDNRAESMIAQ